MRAATIVSVLVALSAPAAGRGEGVEGGPSMFWREILRPGSSALHTLLEAGKRCQREARSQTGVSADRRRSLLACAKDRLLRTAEMEPGSALAHRLLGETLYALDEMRPAATALRRAREIDSSLLNDRTLAFDLGVALCKAGDFGAAVNEYDRVIRLSESDTPANRALRATAQSNAAEALMAVGRLPEAIERYREALAHGDHRLAWWGLAVALDRDEQALPSMAALERAVAGDRALGFLSAEGVFFVPSGDVHYYYGLGYLAAGEAQRAAEAFARFLSAVPDSPWVYRARQHLERIRASGRGRVADFERATRSQVAPGGENGRATLRARRSVRRKIAGVYAALRKCYLRALQRYPGLRGELQLRLGVGSRGGHASVQIRGGPATGAGVKRCLRARLRQIEFDAPPSGRSQTLVVPLVLEP